MKSACQTIVYGNPVIKDTIAEILANVKANGYDGVEIGARHFYMDKPDYYKELLEKNELVLTAIHVGGDFLNPDSVAAQIENISKTIEFAKKLSCDKMYLSGVYREQKTREDYLQEAKVYTRIGQLCNEAGMTLYYHNHNWEFDNNMVGMNILLDNVPAECMKLVPDVGWVTVGGVSPVKFLKDNWDRVGALHFKDFKDCEKPWKFTELGTGIVDFPAIYDFVKSKGADFWITAEQDVYTNTPQESSKHNAEYLNGLIK